MRDKADQRAAYECSGEARVNAARRRRRRRMLMQKLTNGNIILHRAALEKARLRNARLMPHLGCVFKIGRRLSPSAPLEVATHEISRFFDS